MKKTVKLFVICFMMSLLFLFTSISASAAKSYSSTKITKKNPAVVVRVHYSTQPYNAKEEWWVLEPIFSVPIHEKAGYKLYDIVIYSDRMCLFALPNLNDNVYKNGEDAFERYLYQQLGVKDQREYWEKYASKKNMEAIRLKYAKKFREQYLLSSVSVKSGSYEMPDPMLNSGKRYKAYVDFFKMIHKKTPSKNMVLKYEGHGFGAEVFCNSLSPTDTKKILKESNKIFGCKWGFVDFGTQCNVMGTDICRVYAPYADYLLATSQEWLPHPTSSDKYDESNFAKTKAAKERIIYYEDVDAIYSDCFALGSTIKDCAKKSWEHNTNRVKYCRKTAYTKFKVEWGEALVNLKEFITLEKMLHKEKSYGYDPYALSKTKAQKAQYKKAVPYYWSTRSFGIKWKQCKDYGIAW